MSSSVRYILVSVALAVALYGCKSSKKPTPQTPETISIPQPQEDWSTQPMSVPGGPELPVKQGRAPLVYMVEQPNMVRVVDLSSGDVLLRMPVSARTLVAVEPNVGVRVGGATMKLGPLPGDHNYAIYLESTETNITRRGTVRPGRPGAAPMPSTQPARTP